MYKLKKKDESIVFRGKGGEPLEGYLDDRFNGVVFLLKEPNTEDAKIFWFKEVCTRERAEKYFINPIEKDPKKIRASKVTATKFRNTFEKLLAEKCTAVCEDIALEHSVYLNLCPFKGEKTESTAYSKAIRALDQDSEIIRIISQLEPAVVFVHKDIYEKLLQIYKGRPVADSIVYKNKTLSLCCECEIHGQTCRIYGIYHPSARVRLL